MNCPYCQHEVDETRDRFLGSWVRCPECRWCEGRDDFLKFCRDGELYGSPLVSVEGDTLTVRNYSPGSLLAAGVMLFFVLISLADRNFIFLTVLVCMAAIFGIPAFGGMRIQALPDRFLLNSGIRKTEVRFGEIRQIRLGRVWGRTAYCYRIEIELHSGKRLKWGDAFPALRLARTIEWMERKYRITGEGKK